MQSKSYVHGVSVRRAFTLVELLVVISIIGLMTGLIVAGTMKFKDAARVRAADDQVTKYQRALESEYNLVVQKCHKEGPPAPVLAYCGDNMDRARALHIAATLKINFPETIAEATTSFNIQGHPYNAKNTFASVSGATAPTTVRTPTIASSAYERAVLLYLIVKEKATAGTGADTDAGGEQRTEQFGTKSLTYFIDGYGYPLVYYRWADSTINAELDAAPYAPQSAASKDPLDPRGLLNGWNATATSLGFVNKNRVPTVVSFGKNQTFENFGGDDRVGYRLSRFGAKGDGK